MKKLWINIVVLLVGLVLFLNSTGSVLAKVDQFCPGNGPNDAVPKINTALGCVPIQMDKFVEWLLPILFGISGGVAFLLLVYGFIILGASGGDPKKVQGAQETISSAATGLILSILALFILRLIAVDILKIPGF